MVDDTGFPKDGIASPWVARQYCGTLGKTGNCQIGVSVQLVTDSASVAANWRLFCPASWDDTTIERPGHGERDPSRRARAGIADDGAAPGEVAPGVGHARRDDQRLGAAEACRWSRTPATATPPSSASVWTNAACRYVVAVKADDQRPPRRRACRHARPSSGRGRPPEPRYRAGTVQPARRWPWPPAGDAPRQVTWRHGTRKQHHATRPPRCARGSSRLRGPTRPTATSPAAPDGTLPACWLLAEWPPDDAEPTDYWLSNLHADTPLRELVRLAKIRWRIEHDYRELKDRPRPRPLRRPQPTPAGTATSPSPSSPKPSAPCSPRPKSPCAGLTLYAVLRELQHLLAVMAGACHTCKRPYHNTHLTKHY